MNIQTLLIYFNRKLADGLFLDVCKQVSKEFPHIKFNDTLLDHACLNVSLVSWYGGIRIEMKYGVIGKREKKKERIIKKKRNKRERK